MEGPQQDGIAPIVIESKNIDGDDTFPFLDVLLEKNPVDMFCDTRVVVKARPLQIVFKDVSNWIHFFFDVKFELENNSNIPYEWLKRRSFISVTTKNLY